MELKKIISTTLREYLIERKEINMNDNFWKWFGDSKS